MGMSHGARLRVALALAAAVFVAASVVLVPGLLQAGGEPGARFLALLNVGGAICTGIIGYGTASLFGRPGPDGWVRAALGAVASTLLGGLLAGAVATPFGASPVQGMMFLPVLALAQPLAAPVWALGMVGVHLFARQPVSPAEE